MVLTKNAKSAKKPVKKAEEKKGGKAAKVSAKAKVTKPKTSKKATSPTETADKPKLRWFTIQGSGTGFTGGRYAAKDGVVGTASRKAGARLFRDLSETDIKDREKKGKNIKHKKTYQQQNIFA